MREFVTLAASQRVFVESPSEAQPCQSVSQHLVRCLSHWIWHVVHWWQQWAFCHLLSSANSMSNYTAATNLITVAEEIARFNSFQLDLIGAVRSNITHLGYRLPVTFISSEARWAGDDMITEDESLNWLTFYKNEKEEIHRSQRLKCLL